MPYNKITNEMLYVPFTHEYNVPVSVREKLTTKTFFMDANCNSKVQ